MIYLILHEVCLSDYVELHKGCVQYYVELHKAVDMTRVVLYNIVHNINLYVALLEIVCPMLSLWTWITFLTPAHLMSNHLSLGQRY